MMMEVGKGRRRMEGKVGQRSGMYRLWRRRRRGGIERDRDLDEIRGGRLRLLDAIRHLLHDAGRGRLPRDDFIVTGIMMTGSEIMGRIGSGEMTGIAGGVIIETMIEIARDTGIVMGIDAKERTSAINSHVLLLLYGQLLAHELLF
jgi:hypothetical protein